MAAAEGDIVLDEDQQTLYDEMCFAIDALDDGIALMHRTQDFVNLLLRRADDVALRDQTLAEVSRFFLGVIKAADLSPEYRIRRLKLFAKASVELLISKRPQVERNAVEPEATH
ncbi:hypothetical protein CU669_03175 [Paramagnetospirillum kuznetsovii]|uniref:Uncharacterized protein n=1 Tax=Paramagnetospirillum kuznetsovii TaxID=2053833 RepID=A0A364P1Y9_9PROT|nr:hypothetical protein [Paramagnetospirillum kuznetsovii]RAU23177.1 hypothetical protein CU669_03175 [Paramagnetospirillum kuznetsovii]